MLTAETAGTDEDGTGPVLPGTSGTEPEDGAAPDDAPLTQEQVAETVREVLAQELPAALTADQVAEAVRGALAPLLDAVSGVAVDPLPAVPELAGRIEELRAEVAALAGRQPVTPAERTPEAPADPDHSKVLRQAAGISSAVLVCHRDLWELLSGWAGGHPHFRMPPSISDQGENRIAAHLSGRSLVAVLISLAALRRTATPGDGDSEFADAVNQRITERLASLSPDTGPLVTITLDDRAPHSPADTADAPAPA